MSINEKEICKDLMNSTFKIPIDYLGFDRILFKSYEFLFFGDFDDSELDCSR